MSMRCAPILLPTLHLPPPADRMPIQVRNLVLTRGKTLLTPQPRLRTGFFSRLTLDSFPPNDLNEACTSAGR
jgi:hypothetical protein